MNINNIFINTHHKIIVKCNYKNIILYEYVTKANIILYINYINKNIYEHDILGVITPHHLTITIIEQTDPTYDIIKRMIEHKYTIILNIDGMVSSIINNEVILDDNIMEIMNDIATETEKMKIINNKNGLEQLTDYLSDESTNSIYSE